MPSARSTYAIFPIFVPVSDLLSGFCYFRERGGILSTILRLSPVHGIPSNETQIYKGSAAHADIADANQTVGVYALPHTGDATDLASASWAAAAGMAMAAIGAYLARVRKEQSL